LERCSGHLCLLMPVDVRVCEFLSVKRQMKVCRFFWLLTFGDGAICSLVGRTERSDLRRMFFCLQV
jgi:hypothetical protein